MTAVIKIKEIVFNAPIWDPILINKYISIRGITIINNKILFIYVEFVTLKLNTIVHIISI